MDTAEGIAFEPKTLHRYLYASNNPINRIDPGGNEDGDIASNLGSMAAMTTIASMAVLAVSNFLQKVKFELPIRANHYTTWATLALIQAAGAIDSPSGQNYFTTDYYLSGLSARKNLALDKTPQVFINLTLYIGRDGLIGPNPVGSGNNQLGGGTEYYTNLPIYLASRNAVTIPLWN